MISFESISDIIGFAIRQEQIAIDFYLELASKKAQASMRAVFEEFAAEEMDHKAKLLKVLEEGAVLFSPGQVKTLNISDYVAYPGYSSADEVDYETALRIAMNRENAAYKLYTRLAEIAAEPGYKELFLYLAGEESKHKLRFEVEYDEYVLKNN